MNLYILEWIPYYSTTIKKTLVAAVDMSEAYLWLINRQSVQQMNSITLERVDVWA